MRKLVYKVENKKGYIGNIKTLARAKEIAESIQGRITSYLIPMDESVATKKYVGKTPVTPYVPPYKKWLVSKPNYISSSVYFFLAGTINYIFRRRAYFHTAPNLQTKVVIANFEPKT